MKIPELFSRKSKGSVLGRQIEAVLCPGMVLPPPLEQLFCWIEARGQFVETASGRTGYLGPQNQDDPARGTHIQFAAIGNADLKYWFGTSDAAVIGRLCVFAQTGWDGSMAAFWLDDAGIQTIVHLGSGSGSVMVCSLADNPVDFLRLLAIGYDEICWGDGEYAAPPDEEGHGGLWRDHSFVAWVEQTFKVMVPDRGAAIVLNPATILDTASGDRFWQWVQKIPS